MRAGNCSLQVGSLKQLAATRKLSAGAGPGACVARDSLATACTWSGARAPYSTMAVREPLVAGTEGAGDLATPGADVEEFGQFVNCTVASAKGGQRANADGAAVVDRFREGQATKDAIPSLQEYNGVLAELADCRDFARAWQVREEMRGAGVAGDADTYSAILRAGQRTLRLHEVRQLFGEALEHRDSHAAFDAPTAPKTPTLFFAQMQQVLQEMTSSGLHPTMSFYEDLANVLATSNQAGVLINVSTAMEKQGLQPSTRFYNRLMYCLPRCGLLERAGMLFNRMVLRGTADYYTYLTRASGLVYAGQCEAARQVINSAKAHFPLDTVAFNIIIKSHLERDSVDQAVGVFNQMTRDPSVAPNRVTCRTFLSYFFESGALAQADAIIRYFPQAKFPETTEDYANLIKFFARYDPAKVMGLMKDVESGAIPTDAHIYHAFLRILTDRQITPDWKRTFGAMLLKEREHEHEHEHEHDPEHDPEHEHAGKGDTEGLSGLCADLPFHFRQLIRQMEQTQIRPNGVTYEISMRKLVQMKRFDLVTRLYNHMSQQSRELSIQAVHRNFQLTALLCGGKMDEAGEFVKSMQSRRVVVSGRNASLMEKLGMEMPRGLLTAKAGYVSRSAGRKETTSFPTEKRAYRPRGQEVYADSDLNMV